MYIKDYVLSPRNGGECNLFHLLVCNNVQKIIKDEWLGKSVLFLCAIIFFSGP